MGKLTEINQEFIDTIKNSDNSDVSMSLEFNAAMDRYKIFIENFFIDKKDSMTKIYDIIKTNAMPYNVVQVVDVLKSLSMYSDYFVGLLEFANKVVSLRDTDDINTDSIQNLLGNVSEKDKEFMESIFGGERNPVTSSKLGTAVLNVESFIQILENIKNFRLAANKIVNVADTNNSEKYKISVNCGICIFMTSMSTFVCKCLQEVVHTYEEIMSSIKERTPVGGVQETKKYQLF